MEARALAGIRERLLTPALIKRFAALLQLELATVAQAGNVERATAEQKLAETRTRIDNLVSQIEDDEDAPRALTTRVKNLEAEERRLEETIAATTASLVVRLPANYESLYGHAIAELDAHLASDDGAAARNTIRPLIEKIVVQPGSARGGKRRPIQLQGDLYRMLAFAERACASNAQKPRAAGPGVFVIPLVAGTGFEPVTFRL